LPPNIEKLAARRDIEGLEQILCDPKKNLNLRIKAAIALGNIGDSQAVQILTTVLGESPLDKEREYVRQSAATMLIQIGSPSVWPLFDSLRTSFNLKKWEAVAYVLVQIGSPAVQPLLDALRNSSFTADNWGSQQRLDAAREVATHVLANIVPRPVDSLISAIGYCDFAIEALVRYGAASVEPLIAALGDTTNPDVREKAAYALGKIGDGRAVEPLIAALGDTDSDVRKKAAEALEQLNWQPEPNETGAVYWIIKGRWNKCVQLATVAVQPLIAALGDTAWRVREKAAYALGKIGDGRAVEPLIAVLGDTDSAVRRNAAEALVQIGLPSVEPLIVVLGDTDSDVRRNAAEALGKIGDGRAVEPLIVALGDTNSTVCHQAAIALERLHWQPEQIEASAPYYVFTHQWDKCVELGTVAVPPLIVALQDTDSDFRARGQAALALGKIGDERAVEPLIANLRDLRPKEVRWGAAQGLAMLYRSGNLDQSMKRLILSHRETMARPHTDNHVDHDPDVTSECNTRTNFHTDHGIGVYL
jgi:HEAT repeat protein